jgi:hypothetical protein
MQRCRWSRWQTRGETNWVIIEHRLPVVSVLGLGLPWDLQADESVGHCRRRKIRCLLAPEGVQGKCQNCIRLKKDCNFFPVDQQTDVDARSRSDSKLDAFSNEAGTSNSSSPSFPGSRVAEHLDDPSQRLQELPSSGIRQDIRALGLLSKSLTTPASRGKPC